MESKQYYFAPKRFWGLVTGMAFALIPVLYAGWVGIVPSSCLSIAVILWFFGKRRLAMWAIACLLVLGFILPALDGAREAILRVECRESMEKLAKAIQNYESEHGSIPPAFSTDSEGKPLHSWRVLLLPYLGEKLLYDQIDKTRPWDDPVNVPYHNKMPRVFCCGAVRYHSKWLSIGNTTAYVVVVGKNTPWRADNPPSLKQLVKLTGPRQTIAIIESEAHRIPWMSPNDPLLNDFWRRLDFSKPHGGVVHAICFDETFAVLGEGFTNDTSGEFHSIQVLE